MTTPSTGACYKGSNWDHTIKRQLQFGDEQSVSSVWSENWKDRQISNQSSILMDHYLRTGLVDTVNCVYLSRRIVHSKIISHCNRWTLTTKLENVTFRMHCNLCRLTSSSISSLPHLGFQRPRRGRPSNVYRRFGRRWILIFYSDISLTPPSSIKPLFLTHNRGSRSWTNCQTVVRLCLTYGVVQCFIVIQLNSCKYGIKFELEKIIL